MNVEIIPVRLSGLGLEGASRAMYLISVVYNKGSVRARPFHCRTFVPYSWSKQHTGVDTSAHPGVVIEFPIGTARTYLQISYTWEYVVRTIFFSNVMGKGRAFFY